MTLPHLLLLLQIWLPHLGRAYLSLTSLPYFPPKPPLVFLFFSASMFLFLLLTTIREQNPVHSAFILSWHSPSILFENLSLKPYICDSVCQWFSIFSENTCKMSFRRSSYTSKCCLWSNKWYCTPIHSSAHFAQVILFRNILLWRTDLLLNTELSFFLNFFWPNTEFGLSLWYVVAQPLVESSQHDQLLPFLSHTWSLLTMISYW